MELKASLKMLGVAAALASASTAYALDTAWGSVAPGTTMSKTFSGQYLGAFEDKYSFSLLTGGADGSLKRSITVTMDEDAVLMSGFSGLSYGLYNGVTNALIASTYEALSKTYLYSGLSAGSYYLKVAGTGWANAGTAAPIYNGFASITASVPEPQTYAMFLAGLGIVGTVIRRRSRSF